MGLIKIYKHLLLFITVDFAFSIIFESGAFSEKRSAKAISCSFLSLLFIFFIQADLLLPIFLISLESFLKDFCGLAFKVISKYSSEDLSFWLKLIRYSSFGFTGLIGHWRGLYNFLLKLIFFDQIISPFFEIIILSTLVVGKIKGLSKDKLTIFFVPSNDELGLNKQIFILFSSELLLVYIGSNLFAEIEARL